MSSESDSDDEPLSIIAATNRLSSQKIEIKKVSKGEIDSLSKKANDNKNLPLTIKIRQAEPEPKERPADVWLYFKDLNHAGPYSCLLCPEWFINRTKMMIHYMLNHRKDYCGICRYFVTDREAWHSHVKFHSPWSCSQCEDTFPSEEDMRQHLSAAHNLVHCRLCHFRLSDDQQYNEHLIQKHNLVNIDRKNEDVLWTHEYDGSPKYTCILCTKTNNLAMNFFNHYMGYHHFTLKCFSTVLSGKDHDIPFTVDGADVTSQFVDIQLRNQMKIGYLEAEKNIDSKPTESILPDSADNSNAINILIPEIKQETTSDTEGTEPTEEKDVKAQPGKSERCTIISYDGDEDFDITLMELVVLQKCYYDYMDHTVNQIKARILPEESSINYNDMKKDTSIEITCSLCETKLTSLQGFSTHMWKMHSVKSMPTFSCRVCATTFDNLHELQVHMFEEMKDFDDLWICQFCEKEFDNREATRRHLNEHWDVLEYDNCFSPHLGFKCRYCPTLFWNETDRKTHQIRVHFSKHKEDYYKCESCLEVFSDKVWFIYHYFEKHKTEKDNSLFVFKCCVCCIVLSSIEEMRNHFGVEHPGARKVYCSLGACLYKPLSHKKSLKIHVKLVHNTVKRRDRCSCVICGRDFLSSRACTTHMAQVHGPGKFKCKLCNEVMTTGDERKLHYLIRHPGKHPFQCNECGKSFQYKSSLYMHKQEHRPNNQTYTCTYCGKNFKKKDSFREHVQIHEGPRHACSYCPARFVQRSNMLRHERRHTGERPYSCEHCDRTFSDKGAATSHARTHTKDTAYACLYCGATFVQKSKLTYHIRKHTGENLETCTICSKLFTSACSLREHMKTHKDKKDAVACPLCGKKYQDEKYMMRHLRTIHATVKYDCPLCNKSLTSVSGLRQHVVTHSDVSMYRCKLCPKAYAVRRTLIRHLRRRHFLKGSNAVMKEFYHTSDPRECNLNLDEETMTRIFGPPKKKADLVIGDYITMRKLAENYRSNAEERETGDEGSEDENEREDDERDDDMADSITDHIQIELEPTDFVSVKIEQIDPMEEDYE